MADKDFKTAIVDFFASSVGNLCIALGAVFILLGAAGGITYDHWFPIQELAARGGCGALGVTLIVVGLFRANAKSVLKADAYGIKIASPIAGSAVSTADVAGDIDKALPDGYCLWVFRIYLDSDKYVPLSKAFIDLKAKTWVAHNCYVGGKLGDKRAYGAYICGPSAEALIKYHKEAADAHRETMKDFKNRTGLDAGYLPAIQARTADMYECDRVKVVHA
jgi:hypothetical protein